MYLWLRGVSLAVISLSLMIYTCYTNAESAVEEKLTEVLVDNHQCCRTNEVDLSKLVTISCGSSNLSNYLRNLCDVMVIINVFLLQFRFWIDASYNLYLQYFTILISKFKLVFSIVKCF